LMAKDTIDAAETILGRHAGKSVDLTENIKLVGSQHFDETIAGIVAELTGCEKDMVIHLVEKYGDRALVIAENMLANPGSEQRLVTGLPYSFGELAYVIENEMACTVKDVLNRRWGVQLFNWQQTLTLIAPVGKWMTEYFNWNEQQQQLYIHDYEQEVKAMMGKINGE